MHRIFKNIRALSGPQGDEGRSNFWRISRRVLWDLLVFHVLGFLIICVAWLIPFIAMAVAKIFFSESVAAFLNVESDGGKLYLLSTLYDKFEIVFWVYDRLVVMLASLYLLIRASRMAPIHYAKYICLIAALALLLSGVFCGIGSKGPFVWLFLSHEILPFLWDAEILLGYLYGVFGFGMSVALAILWRWHFGDWVVTKSRIILKK